MQSNLSLTSTFKVTKINQPKAALVKKLDLHVDDHIKVTMPINEMPAGKARYIDIVNLTRGITLKDYSLKLFCNTVYSEPAWLHIGIYPEVELINI